MCWDCRNSPPLLILLVVLLLAGCGEESTPEQQIRKLIGDVEVAVEMRAAMDVAEFLHSDYGDEWHQDKRSAVRSLLGYILRHKSIHLLTVIRTVELDADAQRARAVVFVAMTGTPVESIEALVSVKADLMRFDVDLVRENDEWRVIGSTWRRVDLAAF